MVNASHGTSPESPVVEAITGVGTPEGAGLLRFGRRLKVRGEAARRWRVDPPEVVPQRPKERDAAQVEAAALHQPVLLA